MKRVSDKENDKMEPASNKLEPLDDPTQLLLRHPHKFLDGEEKASGEILAKALVGDLIYLRALPATVRNVGAWWSVASDIDWLRVGDVSTTDFFSRIVPFPEAGPNSMHSEVLIAAFADAIVTSGNDGVVWVKGDKNSNPIPREVDLNQTEPGRVVLFHLIE